MRAIADCTQKLLVAMGTANVFWWASSSALETLGGDIAFDRTNDAFQPEFMNPPISEIVFVEYPIAFLDKEPIEPDAGLIESPIGVSRIRCPEGPLRSFELMKVIVQPPHGCLQHKMQLLQRD
jgi:hypothetical protein